ncbi:MAG TPA: acyltransferase [Solirubrobacteraceae bacterium]|nr:acyltransferase [Solirubrobacteraceae bacterium]
MATSVSSSPRDGALGQARTTTPGRVRSLDGLRGIAALIVVFNHVGRAALTWYFPPGGPRPPISSWQWWLTETPLHVLWAGPEMVIVFFVLSGYVLALPARSRGREWFTPRYYPRRLVRLYLPAWGALLFAAAVNATRPTHAVAGMGIWLNHFAVHASLPIGLRAATLLSNADPSCNFTTVLWSMRWEVLFSLVLPLAIIPVIDTRARPRAAAALALTCLAVTFLIPGINNLATAGHYLALFELGALLAFHSHLLPRIPSSARLISGLAIGVCVLLLTLTYWTVSDDVSTSTGWPALGVVVGAVMAVWLAYGCEIVTRLLSSRPATWLGSRSYSLYLVHQPLVITIAFALGRGTTVLELLAASVPPSLLAAELFWRGVERPAIALSHRVAGPRLGRTPLILEAQPD